MILNIKIHENLSRGAMLMQAGRWMGRHDECNKCFPLLMQTGPTNTANDLYLQYIKT